MRPSPVKRRKEQEHRVGGRGPRAGEEALGTARRSPAPQEAAGPVDFCEARELADCAHRVSGCPLGSALPRSEERRPQRPGAQAPTTSAAVRTPRLEGPTKAPRQGNATLRGHPKWSKTRAPLFKAPAASCCIGTQRGQQWSSRPPGRANQQWLHPRAVCSPQTRSSSGGIRGPHSQPKIMSSGRAREKQFGARASKPKGRPRGDLYEAGVQTRAQEDELVAQAAASMRRKKEAEVNREKGMGAGLADAARRAQMAREQAAKDKAADHDKQTAKLAVTMKAMELNEDMEKTQQKFAELSKQEQDSVRELESKIQHQFGTVAEVTQAVATHVWQAAVAPLHADMKRRAQAMLFPMPQLRVTMINSGKDPDMPAVSTITRVMFDADMLEQQGAKKLRGAVPAQDPPRNTEVPWHLFGQDLVLPETFWKGYVASSTKALQVDGKQMQIDMKVTAKPVQVMVEFEIDKSMSARKAWLQKLLNVLTHTEAETMLLRQIVQALQASPQGEDVAQQVMYVFIQSESGTTNRRRVYHTRIGYQHREGGPNVCIGLQDAAQAEKLKNNPIVVKMSIPGAGHLPGADPINIVIGRTAVMRATAITSAEQAALHLNQQRLDKLEDAKTTTESMLQLLSSDGAGFKDVCASLTTLILHMRMLGPKWVTLREIAQTAFDNLVAAQELSLQADKPELIPPALEEVKGRLQSIEQQMETAEVQTRMGYLQVDCDSTKINRKQRQDLLKSNENIGELSSWELVVHTDRLAQERKAKVYPQQAMRVVMLVYDPVEGQSQISLPSDGAGKHIKARWIKMEMGGGQEDPVQTLLSLLKQGQIVWLPTGKVNDITANGPITTVTQLVREYGSCALGELTFDIRNIHNKLNTVAERTDKLLQHLGKLRMKGDLATFTMSSMAGVTDAPAGYMWAKHLRFIEQHKPDWRELVAAGENTQEAIIGILQGILLELVQRQCMPGIWIPGHRFIAGVSLDNLGEKEPGKMAEDTLVTDEARMATTLLKTHPLMQEANGDEALSNVLANLINTGRIQAVPSPEHTLLISSDNPFVQNLDDETMTTLVPGAVIKFHELKCEKRAKETLKKRILQEPISTILFLERLSSGALKEITRSPGEEMRSGHVDQVEYQSLAEKWPDSWHTIIPGALNAAVEELISVKQALLIEGKRERLVMLVPPAMAEYEHLQTTAVWGGQGSFSDVETFIGQTDIMPSALPQIASMILKWVRRCELRTFTHKCRELLAAASDVGLRLPGVHLGTFGHPSSIDQECLPQLREILQHPIMNDPGRGLQALESVMENSVEYTAHAVKGGTIVISGIPDADRMAYLQAFTFALPISLAEFKERVSQQRLAEARQAGQQQLRDTSKTGSSEAGDESMGEACETENAASSAMGLSGDWEARQADVAPAEAVKPRKERQRHSGRRDRSCSTTNQRSRSPADRDKPAQSSRSRSPEKRSRTDPQAQG